jgi:hypothetical protein
MRVDDLEEFGGVKWFRERADRPESFSFVAHLRAAVRSDEKNRDLRL